MLEFSRFSLPIPGDLRPSLNYGGSKLKTDASISNNINNAEISHALHAFIQRARGPYLLPSLLTIAVVSGTTWIYRDTIWVALQIHPPARGGFLFASVVLVIILILWIRLGELIAVRSWRIRLSRILETASTSGLDKKRSVPPSTLDPFERLFSRTYCIRWIANLRDEWQLSEYGKHGSGYLLLLILLCAAGWIVGVRIGGGILAIAFACLFPYVLTRIVKTRAGRNGRRFPEQLPQALDTLASGLSAGLSFQQAIGYACERIPKPVADIFSQIRLKLELGHSVEETLQSIQRRERDEALSLLIEGILLQRQFGGDLVCMLEDTASLIRERNEMESEARAVTAQGRLSGIVIAALVPISAGLLLLFNPQYIDVLFDSTLGQVFIVLAMALLLIGWGVISRLIRIRY